MRKVRLEKNNGAKVLKWRDSRQSPNPCDSRNFHRYIYSYKLLIINKKCQHDIRKILIGAKKFPNLLLIFKKSINL